MHQHKTLVVLSGCLPENNSQESWHKVAKRNISTLLRGSIEKCLETTIPRLAALDGLRMPDKLSFKLYSVSSEILKKAFILASDTDRYIFSDTPDEYYVLRMASDFKKVDTSLIMKYRAMLHDEELSHLPTDKEKKYKALVKIAKSVRRVVPAEENTIPESHYFNPFNLACRCYAGRHDGICAHVIAVNSFKNPELIGLDKWLRAKKRKRNHRPAKIYYLNKNGDESDSSEDTENSD